MFYFKLTNGAMVKWWNGKIKIRIGRFFSHKHRIYSCVLFLNTNIFGSDKEIHNLQFLINNNKYSNQAQVIKTNDHWRTGIYKGSANRCEGDCDSDLNFMDSAILGNTLLQPKRVSDCPRPERDILSIAIVDIILRSALVRFSILRARYYYNSTGG